MFTALTNSIALWWIFRHVCTNSFVQYSCVSLTLLVTVARHNTDHLAWAMNAAGLGWGSL